MLFLLLHSAARRSRNSFLVAINSHSLVHRTVTQRILSRARPSRAVTCPRPRVLSHTKFHSRQHVPPLPRASVSMTRVTSFTALGLISGAVAMSFPFKESTEVVVNKDTQHSFPRELRNNSDDRLTLIGSAVRTVTVLQFYTYTLGLYLADSELQALRQQFGAQVSPAQAATALAALGEHVTARGPGTVAVLRIVPYRKATPPHLLGSLSRATCQRVKEVHGTEARDWCAALAASLPGVKEIEPGHVIDIELRRDGSTCVYWQQQRTATLAPDTRAQAALLQLFTGPKSRTPAVQQALVEGLRSVLAQ